MPPFRSLTWTYSACLALLVGTLTAPLSAAAAPTSCPEHFASGSAPDLVRPALAAQITALCFERYAVLHSGVSRTPLAVAEHLTRARMAAARETQRDGNFHEEQRLSADERARLADYARSGFDRGHMAPAGDMGTSTSMAESFSLANMVPQNPGSNRCIWEGIESSVRRLAADASDVFVVTGPILAGDTLETVGGRVLVPTSLYKAVYVPRRGPAAYLVETRRAWHGMAGRLHVRVAPDRRDRGVPWGGDRNPRSAPLTAGAAAEQRPRRLRAAGRGRKRGTRKRHACQRGLKTDPLWIDVPVET
jgi:DNA/RNA endonuclease G (NUC1)